MADFDQDALAEMLAGSLLTMVDTEAAVKEANSLDVPLWAFKKAVKFIARIGPKQDVASRSWAMTVIFAGSLNANQILPVSRAIELRMQALGRLRTEPAFKAWSLKTSKTALEVIDELLVEVAARQPLIVCDGRPAFETESFFQATLERSDSRGNA